MEAYQKGSSKTKAIEILYFQSAEIEKFKNNSPVFASSGSLNVLYFSNYSRIVLQVNDWKFPLVRRLPILSEGDSNAPSYLFPAQNGFFYRLRINTGPCQGLKNFEAILENNSNYSIKGQATQPKELETSPDDKLTRHAIKETGPKEVITETLKQFGEKANILVQNLKTGTKNLTSTKKRVNLKDIKNRNFKKRAHTTFKKGFFEKGEKRVHKIRKLRNENVNQTKIERYEDLRTHHVPALYIGTDEIEDLILNNKELATKGGFNMAQYNTIATEQKTGPIDDLKREVTNIEEAVSKRVSETSTGRSRQGPMESNVRSRNMVGVQGQPEINAGGINHYHG